MSKKNHLKKKSILLIITGSISAYKSADIIRRLREKDITVKSVMTKSAEEFITPLLIASLSEQPTYTDMWSLKDETEIGHIKLSREADLILVAPASANIIGKLANGLCDNLASTILMATDKPIMVAPAMNPVMWSNPATQDNISTLKSRGIEILEPESGLMACGETGVGRLMKVDNIVKGVEEFFFLKNSLKDKKILITAGPTYEAIDPVRFIGNFSSGKQGYAIAKAVAMAGANTTLITGPTYETPPNGVLLKKVTSADEMLDATLNSLPADIVICAAAVADWKPENIAKDKIKKGKEKPQLSFVENPDILKTISQLKENRPELVIGFAAETRDIKNNAKKKLSKKRCDWILANDVSLKTQTLGGDFNQIEFLQKKNNKITETSWSKMSKDDVALKLVNEIIKTIYR